MTSAMTDFVETRASCCSSQVFERQHEWFALFLAHGAALIFSFATYHLLDRIERGDAVQSFARDWRRTALCDIEELSSQMNPTKGERDRIAGPCVIGNGLVGRVAVALHDAAIALKQLQPVDRAAPGA